MDCQHMFLRQANSKIGALLSFFGPAWQPNQQSKSSTDNMRERRLFNQMVQVHIKYYCGETFYMGLQTLNVRLLTKARKPTGLDRAFLWCTLGSGRAGIMADGWDKRDGSGLDCNVPPVRKETKALYLPLHGLQKPITIYNNLLYSTITYCIFIAYPAVTLALRFPRS